MSGPTDLSELVRKASEDESTDSVALARRILPGITPTQLRDLAALYLALWIDNMRRGKAHEAERAAAPVQAPVVQREPSPSSESELLARYEEWLDNPMLLDWGRNGVCLNAVERRRFVRWLGKRYEDWYARGCETVDRAQSQGLYTTPGRAKYFKADYSSEGPREWFANDHAISVGRLINQVATEVRLETTRELLDTVFALGDGRKTTWGKATVEEHEQRVALLTGNASGVVETAARHIAAIAMIRAAGAICLADLAGGEEEDTYAHQ